MNPLAAAAERTPERDAIRSAGLALSYAQLSRDVGAMAARLHAEGVRPGDLVGVAIGQAVAHWCVVLALLRLGATSVSLTTRAAAEVAALPGLTAVVSLGAPAVAGPRAVMLDPAAFAPAAHETPLPPATGARVTFTSGSSGDARPILLDADTLARRLAKTARRSRIDADTVFWPGLGPDSAYGFTAVVATWMAGGTVVLGGRPESLGADLVAAGVTAMIASPVVLEAVLRTAPAGRIATVIVAGGRLSRDLRDRARRIADAVLVAYGTSEAGGVTLGDAALLDADPGAVGTPFPDVDVAIVDDTGAPVPAGVEGWIRLASDSIVAEYLGDPAATARHFAGGAFRPGDRGVLAPDGTLLLRGRDADTLNVGGVKLSAARIEAFAGSIEGVVDAVAVVASDGRLAVAVVAAGDLEPLRRRLRTGLPELPPFVLVRVEAIPRTAMGKVSHADRQSLQDFCAQAPRT